MTTKTNTQNRAPINRLGYNTENKSIKPFAKAFRSLKVEDAAVVKRVICERCNIGSAYFSHKKIGHRGLTEYEEAVIRSTFRCFGIDAFTGETIQN